MIWIAAGLIVAIFALRCALQFMANCDDRNETYPDPDPKPLKRRPF